MGYVSPDFRRHPVASFIEPILAAHDRNRVEVFCYAVHLKPDHVTARLKSLTDHWREIGALDARSAAEVIRADRIDVLIDLAGHTVTCADTDLDGEVPQGIVLFGKKSKVSNGIVVGCMNGIAVGGDGKHSITAMTSQNSVQDGVDIVEGADKCKLLDVTANHNVSDGFEIDSDKNKELGKQYALDGSYIPRTYFLDSNGKVDPEIHAPREQFKYFYDERNPQSVLAGMDTALKKFSN